MLRISLDVEILYCTVHIFFHTHVKRVHVKMQFCRKRSAIVMQLKLFYVAAASGLGFYSRFFFLCHLPRPFIILDCTRSTFACKLCPTAVLQFCAHVHAISKTYFSESVCPARTLVASAKCGMLKKDHACGRRTLRYNSIKCVKRV